VQPLPTLAIRIFQRSHSLRGQAPAHAILQMRILEIP
jgi:hypothetical protein